MHLEAPKVASTKTRLLRHDFPVHGGIGATKRGVRRPLRVEFALKNRKLVKAEVSEKRVFEQTTPLK